MILAGFETFIYIIVFFITIEASDMTQVLGNSAIIASDIDINN